MEENYSILPLVDSCKPLLVSPNKLLVKTDEINAECYKKTKNHWLLINVIITSISFFIFVAMRFTNVYNYVILQQVVLKNNSDMLSWWLKPPVDPIVKVYIFNYTNIDQFLDGTDAKIKVKQLGPYSYREPVEKVNLFFDNDLISFNENRSNIYDASLSGVNVTEDDLVVVPNIPFISAIPNVKKLGFFAEIGFKTILTMTQPKEFNTLSVKKFLFGYRDDFMSLVSKIKWDFTPEDVGILAPRHGLSKNRITVNLGLNDVENSGKVIAVNGKVRNNIWKSEKCNNIGGSDGALYGPETTKNNQDLHVYLPEICRSLPMRFEEKSSMFGVPSKLYKPYFDIFSTPQNASNYCELKSLTEKHVNGVMDVSDCINGSPPVLVSYAHFMEGDQKLFELFEGLNPDRSEHSPLAHIHPRLGVPIYGISNMQLNLRVTSFGKHFERLNDVILPIAYVVGTIQEFPLKYKILLYLSTYVVDFMEVILKFGSIVGIFVSLWYFSHRIFLSENQKN